MIDYSGISEIWSNNDSQARFKVGDKVVNGHDGKTYRVKGVNLIDVDEDGCPVVEYALAGFPFLVYESHLSLPK